MVVRKLGSGILVIAILCILVGCGSNTDPTPTATVTIVVGSPSSTISPTINGAASTTAITVSTPSAAVTEATDAPAEYTLVDSSEDESIPTPDLAKKQSEMLPTAVIVDGEYPYPTANSAIDSDGDGFYTIQEVEQAVRETYPPYEWPAAYHPSVDDIFVITDFNRIPEGAEFEVPMELALLGNLNRCAWQQNWLDAFSAGDQEKMDRSMLQLRATVLTNPANVYTSASATEMFNQAELGDPALIIRDINLNCVGFSQWVDSQGSNLVPKDKLWSFLAVAKIARI